MRVREESTNLTTEESNLFMAYAKEILLQGVQEMKRQDNLGYLDTGASSHMTSKKSYFHSIDENKHGLIRFGDESLLAFEGKRSIMVNYSNEEELKLEGVLFVTTLKVNILSLGKLDDDGFTSTLGGGILSIFDNKGKVFARIRKTSGSMYLLKLSISEFSQITQGVWLWHHRLCHQNFRTIDDMRRSDMVRGLPNFHFSDHLSRNCVAGKHNRSAFPHESEYKASKRLQLIHGDICGPIQPSTVGGRRYYFLLVDDYSRLMWVAFLKEKLDEFQYFKRF